MMGAAALTSCGDDFVSPPMVVPSATIEANTSILDLKTAYWTADRNYVKTIGLNDAGEHTIIRGRVISSDQTGNIYKSVIIYDGSAALNLSINAYDLYQTYQFGQEVVIDVTELNIGGYNGLMQLGGEGTYNNAPSMTFMDSEVFAAHAQVDGLSNPQLVDTIPATIPDVLAAKQSTEGLILWQSRLVRFDNVRWDAPGKPYAEGTSSTNRYIIDESGNQLLVRNSAYASFKNELLPQGYGSVTGILSYYGTDWQLMLIDSNGCQDFEESDEPDQPVQPGENGDGTKAKPYGVDQVIAMAPGSTTAAVESGVWVKGYIVGFMPTGGDATLLSGTVFGIENAATTNMVIAASADVKDASECIGIQLPASMRDALSLANQPANLGKEVMLQGDVMKYCGGPGLKNLTDYMLDGKGPDVPDTSDAIFSETFAANSLGQFTIENINLPSGLDAVWKGSASYGAVATAYESESQTNLDSDSRLVSPVIDLGSASAPALSFEHALNFFADIATARQQATVEARVEGGEWETLEGTTYPAEMGWSFVPSGSISLAKFAGKKIQIAFHYTSTAAKAGTWEVKNVIIK
jgi:hypothetical protein